MAHDLGCTFSQTTSGERTNSVEFDRIRKQERRIPYISLNQTHGKQFELYGTRDVK